MMYSITYSDLLCLLVELTVKCLIYFLLGELLTKNNMSCRYSFLLLLWMIILHRKLCAYIIIFRVYLGLEFYLIPVSQTGLVSSKTGPLSGSSFIPLPFAKIGAHLILVEMNWRDCEVLQHALEIIIHKIFWQNAMWFSFKNRLTMFFQIKYWKKEKMD